jgi:hypothetical protein
VSQNKTNLLNLLSQLQNAKELANILGVLMLQTQTVDIGLFHNYFLAVQVANAQI